MNEDFEIHSLIAVYMDLKDHDKNLVKYNLKCLGQMKAIDKQRGFKGFM